ncbi:hypothetical protein H4S08_003198 [Coemansia sp. RSA 1365]|nr:hypothetical protein H4S08_003198 [Coemansia sp. RSA 1365]
MVMTPIGQCLRNIKPVFELIIVVYDALKVHTAVLRERRILHRDISENNIPFQRDESGNVSGILIDFNNAVDVAAAHNDRWPICTGTLPFKNLNYLWRTDITCTAIDDMGLTLCVQCNNPYL